MNSSSPTTLLYDSIMLFLFMLISHNDYSKSCTLICISSYLLFHMYYVLCIMYYVFCILYYVLCIMYYVLSYIYLNLVKKKQKKYIYLNLGLILRDHVSIKLDEPVILFLILNAQIDPFILELQTIHKPSLQLGNIIYNILLLSSDIQ